MASKEADQGATFSNFGFDLEENDAAGIPWELENDRELRTIYEYADSYFLSRAHGDPDHVGTSWSRAEQVLEEYVHRLTRILGESPES